MAFVAIFSRLSNKNAYVVPGRMSDFLVKLSSLPVGPQEDCTRWEPAAWIHTTVSLITSTADSGGTDSFHEVGISVHTNMAEVLRRVLYTSHTTHTENTASRGCL